MSGTLWLIVEGKVDGEIVKAILKHRYPQVSIRILKPTGAQPSVSRLAKQIDQLIRQALAEPKRGDCIAVLHDADLQTRPHKNERQDYQHIETVCKKYARQVKHVIAYDEIESWLLADTTFCTWLGTKPQNWDEKSKPSETLINLLDKAGKPKWREDNWIKILENLDGTGDKFSSSLQSALKHLENAPCTRR
ncbi:MAG: hypothetical protein ABI690_00835 [Chloroflexota bacterium]